MSGRLRHLLEAPTISGAILLLTGSASVVLAAVALAGWWFHIPAWTSLGLSYTPMAANTAVGLLLDGAALWFIAAGYPKAALGGAIWSLAIGGMTLAEYAWPVDLHIDQFLVRDYIAAFPVNPGRMAPGTAVCFMLCGVALFWVSASRARGKAPTLIGATGAVVLALGAASVAGYLTSLQSYAWNEWTRMAANTGIGFVAIGLGILTFAWQYAGPERDNAPRWLALASGCGSFAITLCLAYALGTELQMHTERAVRLFGDYPTEAAIAALRLEEQSVIPDVVIVIGAILSVFLVFLVELAFTSKRRAEAAETGRRLLDAVFNTQTDAVLVCNAGGEVIRTNAAAADYFGFEAVGTHITRFFEKFPLSGGLNPSLTWLALHGETTIAAEQTAGDRILETSSAPMRDAEGQITGAVTIARDISQRKRGEQELRAAYTELAAIYANAPVILLVVDEELRTEKLNDLGIRITGREKSDILGLRPGGALGCLDALADPRGCGYAPSCTQCPLRLAVLDSVQNGARHEGVEAWIPFSPSPGQPERRCFLVSTAPLPFDHRHKALVCAQDITELKGTEAELRNSVGKLESALTEKTVLLQEVHHRVKNNLAVISSLLSMKADMTGDGPAKVALEESQRRVHSIALIHEHLYGGEQLDRINFAEYAQQLVRVLHAAFNGDSDRIAIRMDVDPIELGVHLAVPAALILNELLSNALKHAFPGGRSGEIHVTFRESEPGHRWLAIEDDGVGSPDLLGERKTKSLGLQIVRILTAQLGGTLEQEPGCGTRVVLRFPVSGERRATQ